MVVDGIGGQKKRLSYRKEMRGSEIAKPNKTKTRAGVGTRIRCFWSEPGRQAGRHSLLSNPAISGIKRAITGRIWQCLRADVGTRLGSSTTVCWSLQGGWANVSEAGGRLRNRGQQAVLQCSWSRGNQIWCVWHFTRCCLGSRVGWGEGTADTKRCVCVLVCLCASLAGTRKRLRRGGANTGGDGMLDARSSSWPTRVKYQIRRIGLCVQSKKKSVNCLCRICQEDARDEARRARETGGSR